MNARGVHAVLAAGVDKPELIARWQEDPRVLAAFGIDPGALDLAALWKFAGMTVKVRHNGLRAELPLTFRLINAAGLEIELFASYAVFRASHGPRYAPTTRERMCDLVAFLEQWLDRRRTDHALLWDVVRHEQALTELHAMAPTRQQAPRPERRARRPAARTIPRVRGAIVLHAMRCDVRALESALRQTRPDLASIRRATRHVAYWRAEDRDEVRILDLDAFGFYVLASVDGVRSVADLSERLGGTRRPSAAFLASLGQLQSAGLLSFTAAHGARRR